MNNEIQTYEEIVEDYIRRNGKCNAVEIVKALHMRTGTVDNALYRLYMDNIIKSKYIVFGNDGKKNLGYYEYCHVIGPHYEGFKSRFQREADQ